MVTKLVGPDSPRLTQPCHLVPETEAEWETLRTFVNTDLLPAVILYRGVGLAANQLGIPLRVFVINHGGRQIVCVDPSILSHEGSDTQSEGCLSIPGVRVPVSRWTRIRVQYKTPDGVMKTHYMSGMQSRIFQHELDHLNGVLITDHKEDINASS